VLAGGEAAFKSIAFACPHLRWPNDLLLLVHPVRVGRSTPTVNTGKSPPTDPLTPGERRRMIIVAGILAAAVIVGATVWALLAHSSKSDGDTCVTVASASSMGGGLERACGQAARDWCHASYAQRDIHAEAVQAQCRAAGILP
jgi:hypothetical protein